MRCQRRFRGLLLSGLVVVVIALCAGVLVHRSLGVRFINATGRPRVPGLFVATSDRDFALAKQVAVPVLFARYGRWGYNAEWYGQQSDGSWRIYITPRVHWCAPEARVVEMQTDGTVVRDVLRQEGDLRVRGWLSWWSAH